MNISQAFLKALTSGHKLHCINHDIIIKSAESLKLFWQEEVAEGWIKIQIY